MSPFHSLTFAAMFRWGPDSIRRDWAGYVALGVGVISCRFPGTGVPMADSVQGSELLSCAAPRLGAFAFGWSHGLRRGLHSFAPSELGSSTLPGTTSHAGRRTFRVLGK